MKLQFSLATLLVCVTVLAVVCGIAAFVPINSEDVYIPRLPPNASEVILVAPSPKSAVDIIGRVAVGCPLSLAATLTALWLIRRLHNPTDRLVGWNAVPHEISVFHQNAFIGHGE